MFYPALVFLGTSLCYFCRRCTQNVQKMRYPEGRFRFQYAELACVICLAFACYLMLVGSSRILLMYKVCYFYSLLIQIQRFVTVEVKRVLLFC